MSTSNTFNLQNTINEFPVAHEIHTENDFNSLLEQKLIEPLTSGSAYYISIKDFTHLQKSTFLQRYKEFGLKDEELQGYINRNNIFFRPYVINFEFRYDHTFIEELKALLAQISCNRYNDNPLHQIKDLRHFDMPCAVFGDFDLEYIKTEGWHGIKKFHLDTFHPIRLDYAQLLAKKLQKKTSYLYFSLLDSENQSIIGVYSDFHDYSLEYFNTDLSRKIGRIAVNTNRTTFSMYQVEPLSPMALSYRLRLFFLMREKPDENHYAFVIFLTDDEASRINNIHAWANAEL